MEDAMTPRPPRFAERLMLTGLFALGLFATIADASAAERIRRDSFQPRPSVTKQMPSAAKSYDFGSAPRFSPGATSRLKPIAPSTGAGASPGAIAPVSDRIRNADLGRPLGPDLSARLPTQPPIGGLRPNPGAPNANPPTAGGPNTGAPSAGGPTTALPTPSEEERNKRLGACLVGIVSACNGDVPPAPGVAQPGAPQPLPPSGGGMAGGGSGGGSGGGGGFNFSPSFSFGGGGGDSAAATATAAAEPACVADATDVYKQLECAKLDFEANRIDRPAYAERKAQALALLDPATLGADLVFRVLRDLADAGLITAADREAQKRLLIARL